MIELKGLEDWVRGILATPISTLNRNFGSSRYEKGEALIRKSIEDLPLYTRYRPVFREISTPTLRELHQKLRGQKCETNFWSVLFIGVLEKPLPDEIAFDLIERYEWNQRVIQMLGHSLQSDSVMWKLAPLVDEALLTLAKLFYTDSKRTLEELEEALRRFPNHEWMLESLGHCSASSIEKRQAYEKAIENHPKRERWIDISRDINPNQWKSHSHFVSDEDRMKLLYGGYNFQQLLDIARDDQTPDEILHDLEELRGSKEVRIAARHTLRRREEAGG